MPSPVLKRVNKARWLLPSAMRRYWWWLAGVVSLLVSGCGEPRSADPDGFKFDPVPVVTTADGRLVLDIPATPCGSHLADQVVALVSDDAFIEFGRWLATLDFVIVDDTPGRRGHLVAIRVPVGSPPAALILIQKQPGVIAADLQGIALGDVPCTTQ